jgi:ADP-dependent NAD(P)H-hydrate dehydratase / NAD(P)H-hydrate epimerase
MKLFTSEIQKQWDRQTVTVKHQQSIDLMELAAECCTQAILESDFFGHFLVICGTGNNGGDGLAMACLLREAGMVVEVLIIGSSDQGSPEFKTNLQRVMNTDIPVRFFESGHPLHTRQETVIIDCLFGVGVNREVVGLQAEAIHKINQSQCSIISVDVPSGMFSDAMEPQMGPVVKANLTLALHIPKRAFLFAENHLYVGRLQILSLLLDDAFEEQQACDIIYYCWTEAMAHYRPRNDHDYKNKLGHGLIIGGSEGKMGAVLLSSEACMRSGAGLCTMHIPQQGHLMAQIDLREAMVSLDSETHFISQFPELGKFNAVGLGPGLGMHEKTQHMLLNLIKSIKAPIVLDADALNILAINNSWEALPPMSIITPHLGEFDRLFGVHNNNFERIKKMLEIAKNHQIVIVLKGHFTAIASPDGQLSFNGSGFKGLATAGSGDVLVGIITGLLCQGYDAAVAARLGVFLHGEAGHHAGVELSIETMLAGDIISHLSKPFSQLNEIKP